MRLNPPATRRGFLAGFALASTAAAVPAVALASAPTPHPDAALLALDAEMEVALTIFDERDNALDDAVARYEAIKPAIPTDLTLNRGLHWIDPDFPPDAFGTPDPKQCDHRIQIPNRRELERCVRRLDGRTRNGRKVRRLKVLSDAYHDAAEAARTAAGSVEAQLALVGALHVVFDLADKAAVIQAVTLAGIQVRARTQIARMRAAETCGYANYVRPDVLNVLQNVVMLDGGAA